jgi:hypothetical protein
MRREAGEVLGVPVRLDLAPLLFYLLWTSLFSVS